MNTAIKNGEDMKPSHDSLLEEAASKIRNQWGEVEEEGKGVCEVKEGKGYLLNALEKREQTAK